MLSDATAWRLPDWEAFSESARTGSEGEMSDSDGSSLSGVRLPRVTSTTTLTRRRRPLDDLRALHLRFAHERQRERDGEDPQPTKALLETQSQIAAQLERVREELRAFQSEWQESTTATPREEPAAGSGGTSTALVGVRDAESETLRFDMATQTDVASMNDGALQQWLHLLTQKMEVLTTSFHGDTTQLPLKYPLQTHLERPVSFSHEPSGQDTSVASWHVGGSLKAQVSESTAERMLDLERALACLATATRQTTSRYVEYFETIVVQIQDLHQQRLRQVVDESLQEMKNQRSRYKKRVEHLEDDCRAAKQEIEVLQQKAVASSNVLGIDKESWASMIDTQQELWKHEREELMASVEKLQNDLAASETAKSDAEKEVDELRIQLSQMTTLLEMAERQLEERDITIRDRDDKLRELNFKHSLEIERLETMHVQLRSQILLAQEEAARLREQIAKSQAQELEMETDREREMVRIKQECEEKVVLIEQMWQQKLDEAEETKRLLPTMKMVDQNVQTDHELVEEGTTDERIARLKKRCKALENLLDKKFEDSSAASVASVDSAFSGRWSTQTDGHHAGNHSTSGDLGSRTLPLTMSWEGSLNDTITSSHAANSPSRDEIKNPLREEWESFSIRSAASSGRAPYMSAKKNSTRTDPDAPSQDAMLALVRKLEELASSSKLPSSASGAQPDEEPDMSTATTPTRKSRPNSASMKKTGLSPNRSSGLAGSYSAALHSLKDPRRLRPHSSGKSGTGEPGKSTSLSSSSAPHAPPRLRQPAQKRLSSK